MITLSSSEMLAAWRQALGFQPARLGSSIELFEGFDINSAISARMRAWYLDILDNASPDLLPVSDIASESQITSVDENDAYITLPENARRPLSIKLSGWKRPASILSPDKAQSIISRMASPFLRPGTSEPLAVRYGRHIFATPFSQQITLLKAIVDPGPDIYILDESLLSTIPTK